MNMAPIKYVVAFLLCTIVSAYKQTAIDEVLKANSKQAINGNWQEIDDIILPKTRSSAGYQYYSAAMKPRRNLWPNGIIPYKIENSIKRRPNHVKVLKDAMAEWERRTCIRFVDKTNDARVGEYVRVFYGGGCRGSVGRWRGSPSVLSMGRNCDQVFVMLHELGHTIGYFHEQNRPDRDRYVRILWQNIDPINRGAFHRKTRTADSRGSPYDYNSIMHYGTKTFSKNGKPSMKALDPSITYLGNTGLSELDIKQTNWLYKCTDYPKFPADFKFSRGNQPTSGNCVTLREPRDRTWSNINICYRSDKRNISMTFSHKGKIPNMDCTNTIMPSRLYYSRYWRDNYLCVSRDSILKFHWSVNGAINGMDCIGNNRHGFHLCASAQKVNTNNKGSSFLPWSPWQPCSEDCGGGTQMRTRTCRSGRTCTGKTTETRACNRQRCLSWPHWPKDFQFRIGHSKPDLSCAQVYERRQYTDWINHKFCWSINNRRKLKIQWSDSGTIPGMRCTKIVEPREKSTSGWRDNYLCIQNNAPYRLRWSWRGPIRGLKCVQWYAKRGRTGWNNNYLCADRFPIKDNCPIGWIVRSTRTSNTCYLQVNKQLSWTQADADCRRRNAQLLSVTSSSEAKFVRRFVHKTDHAWIGLNDRRVKGQWRWSNGEKVSYTNWRTPLLIKPKENCVLKIIYTSKWRPWPCNDRSSYICKLK